MGKGERNRQQTKSQVPLPPTSRPSFAARAVLSLTAGLLLAAVTVAFSLADRPGPPPSVLHDATTVQALFAGIPEQGNTLGRADAPLTLVTFVDPQCPYCREWETQVLPVLVRDYVRPGRLRIEVNVLHFIGPDSTSAALYLSAAGMQNLLWPTMETLYQNQGEENSGWFSQAFIRSLGRSVQGLNTARWQRDSRSTKAKSELVVAQVLAERAKVQSTPTLFLGRTGGHLNLLNLRTLLPEGTTPFIDAALKAVGR